MPLRLSPLPNPQSPCDIAWPRAWWKNWVPPQESVTNDTCALLPPEDDDDERFSVVPPVTARHPIADIAAHGVNDIFVAIPWNHLDDEAREQLATARHEEDHAIITRDQFCEGLGGEEKRVLVSTGAKRAAQQHIHGSVARCRLIGCSVEAASR